MGAGAAYDAVFAVLILAFTAPAAAVLGLEVPADPVYLHLNGVFLLLLSGLYLLPALDPVRYQGVVAVSAAGRAVGFLFFMAVWGRGGPDAFLATGLGDLAFAVLSAALLLRARAGGAT